MDKWVKPAAGAIRGLLATKSAGFRSHDARRWHAELRLDFRNRDATVNHNYRIQFRLVWPT